VPAVETLPEHTPVLIVGGGPVGLACAVELAHHGVQSLVLERRPEVSRLRHRAKTTSARTMEHFRRWGISEQIRRRAGLPVEWSDTAVFCTTLTGREITRIAGCFGLDLTGSELVAEAGQQVAQPIVEKVLREMLTTSDLAGLAVGVQGVAAGQGEDGAWVDVVRAVGCPDVCGRRRCRGRPRLDDFEHRAIGAAEVLPAHPAAVLDPADELHPRVENAGQALSWVPTARRATATARNAGAVRCPARRPGRFRR
jgi:hypothetical protein